MTFDYQIEEIEHTADWAIRVRARDFRNLFVGAATGMFGLVAERSKVGLDRQVEIELDAIDIEVLLVDWLNELLYLSEEHNVVFFDFSIHALDLRKEGARLRAQARGGQPDELFKVIKATTFGGLAIVQHDDAVQVEIVFDV